VLGQGGDYAGHGTKMALVREAIEGLPAERLVLYTDAWDVIFVRRLEELPTVFGRFGQPLVYSAQQYYHFIDRDKFLQYFRHPPGEAPLPQFRFLNAGCFIGRAGYLRDFIDRLPLRPDTPSDQTVVTRYWLDHPGSLVLDYRQRIFSGTSGREGLEARDFRWLGGGLRHLPSGSYPFAIHFPGENGYCSRTLLQQLPYPLPAPEPSARDRRRYRGSILRKRLISRLGITNYAWELGRTALFAVGWVALAMTAWAYLAG
jgi:hypothetical protein